MYTGYFAKLKNYEEKGLIPISICGKAPDWYNGLQYKVLAPKWGFFNEWKNGSHKGDNDYYVEHFQKEVLDTWHMKNDSTLKDHNSFHTNQLTYYNH